MTWACACPRSSTWAWSPRTSGRTPWPASRTPTPSPRWSSRWVRVVAKLHPPQPRIFSCKLFHWWCWWEIFLFVTCSNSASSRTAPATRCPTWWVHTGQALYCRVRARGAAGQLLGNLVHTFDFLIRTYPFQKTKRSQNVAFSKFLMHFQPFKGLQFHKLLSDSSKLRLRTRSCSAPSPHPTPLRNAPRGPCIAC